MKTKHYTWIVVISMLVLLMAQGWTGDYINLFAKFPVGDVSRTSGGLVKAIAEAGGVAFYHAIEGLLILVFSIIILTLSLRSGFNKLARIFAFWGTLAVLSALIGGVLFVFSGFTNNGASAQMGGSFLSALAGYFLMLFFMR